MGVRFRWAISPATRSRRAADPNRGLYDASRYVVSGCSTRALSIAANSRVDGWGSTPGAAVRAIDVPGTSACLVIARVQKSLELTTPGTSMGRLGSRDIGFAAEGGGQNSFHNSVRQAPADRALGNSDMRHRSPQRADSWFAPTTDRDSFVEGDLRIVIFHSARLEVRVRAKVIALRADPGALRQRPDTSVCRCGLEVGLSDGMTLTATFNPEFESARGDTAVEPLRYETFFPAKRPFFVEGSTSSYRQHQRRAGTH